VTVLTIVLSALAGFLVFWAGVVSLIGFMGWRPLAARYPAVEWPEGEGVRLGWQSARVGLSNYNGVLHAVVTADGLYLRPVRVFAYNHPPVFVPWAAVAALRDGLLGSVVLDLEGGGGMRLGGRLAKEVRRAHAAWHAGAPAPLGSLPDPLEEAAPEDSPPPATWRRTRER
jgi:hypothetical protein